MNINDQYVVNTPSGPRRCQIMAINIEHFTDDGIEHDGVLIEIIDDEPGAEPVRIKLDDGSLLDITDAHHILHPQSVHKVDQVWRYQNLLVKKSELVAPWQAVQQAREEQDGFRKLSHAAQSATVEVSSYSQDISDAAAAQAAAAGISEAAAMLGQIERRVACRALASPSA